jgi:hypothetical protein
MIRGAPLLLAVAGLLMAAPLHAQTAPSPLERFVGTVAYLWSVGDAEAIAELVPERGQVLLDTGSGSEAVNSRHAAAALRALFGERQGTAAKPVRVTLSGGQPARGFGELTWSFRTRGAPIPRSRTVYLGAVWTGSVLLLDEIRLLP